MAFRTIDLGIIGNMGRDASDAFTSLVKAVVGPEIGVYCFDADSYPDRVAWLEGRGRSPAPAIADTMQTAFAMGAKQVVMACNTAHLALPQIKGLLPRWLRDRVIDMVQLTLDYVGGANALWLGTTVLANRLDGVELPDSAQQDIVQAAIWAAKKGEFPYSEEIREIVAGHDVIVAGCTEMPLILREAGIESFVDPARLVAAHVAGIGRQNE